MPNKVIFNQKEEVTKNALCFKDLEIGDVFMVNNSYARFHYIKVKESVLSDGSGFNAFCIEDGRYSLFNKEEKAKKFIGEIALNGIFVEFECEV